MKLETEVNPSLYLFTSPERKVTCTRRPAEESTAAAVADQLSAQDRSASIAAADTLLAAADQLTASHQPPSRCGCGSFRTGFQSICSSREYSSSCCVHHPNPKGSSLHLAASGERQTNGAVDIRDISPISRACSEREDFGSQPPAITALQCEHFQFIDDDDDDEEEEAEMFVCAVDTEKCNGHPDGVSSVKSNGESVVVVGRHLQDDGRSDEVSDTDFARDPTDPKTAQSLCSSFNAVANEMDEASIESELNHDTGETVPSPFISTNGDRNSYGAGPLPPNAATDTKELRSVLKKGKCNNSGKKCRVTFDEAVTLYSDERPDIQVLALRSADINCADVFYMFEPPIEYQDLLPFEPPAEYRDPDDDASENQYEIFYAATQHPETNDAEEEVAGDEDNDEPGYNCEKSEESPMRTDNGIEIKDDEDDDFGSVPTDGGDSAGVAMATVPSGEDAGDGVQEGEASSKGYVEFTESDKLFERFLEAEREFSEDEELNSVFRVLEGDLAAEGKNGAFDDNFFRKLINLLSSVEGDVHLEDGEFFSSTDFTVDDEDTSRDTEEDESGQTPSRTLSEADSDCSISSQDTIIVRLGEDDPDSNQSTLHKLTSDGDLSLEDVSNQDLIEGSCDDPVKPDEVFAEGVPQKNGEDQGLSKKPRPLLHEIGRSPQTSLEKANDENLSRQSSGEQSQSGAPQDPVQDADDSTSSDSRSGEVEEDIRHDDIGYDEEDAEDYDEDCLRGTMQGNSKIRRIIKKNALQCTLLRGIEARRRQPGVKYPRPKSPLPSRDSLVEQLRWLTTLDESGEVDTAMLHAKAPDVILSTGNVHLNGALPHSTSSEDEVGVNNRSLLHPRLPPLHPTQQQQRHLVATDNNGVYIVHPGGFVPQQQHPPLRQWIAPVGQHPQMAQHHLPQYSPPHPMPHPQMQQPEQRVVATVTVPRDFRDWRVIQRVVVNRGGGSTDGRVQPHFPAGFSAVRQCPNGSATAYQMSNPPDVSRTDERTKPISGHDELEQFVQQDIQRIERIRQRYSLAEDDDDPTFGFARRPSVRGIQNRFEQSAAFMNHVHNSAQPVVGGMGQKRFAGRINTSYANFNESVQGPVAMHVRATPESGQPPKVWSRAQTWQMEGTGQTSGYGRSQPPLHIHRASVALSELPGSTTLPHAHPSVLTDTRYHSYAENMYGTTRILNPQGWPSKTVRTCVTPGTAAPHTLQVPLVGAPLVSPPALQVPPHPLSAGIKDERGVPEGASSSPKVSSDSLYHGPVLDSIPVTDTHSNDGVIYYSLNV